MEEPSAGQSSTPSETARSLAVVTDSTPYLPRELIERQNIHEVSLYVGWDGDLRPESDHVKDLGTYASSTFISISPSLFFGIGAHDATPRFWSRIGIGAGAGWAWVHGSAFITQDTVDEANRACYDAASALIAGTGTKAQLRSSCALETFSEKGFGESMRFFVDGRLEFLYASVSAEGLFLDGKDYEFFPMQVAVRLAYMLDL